MDKLENGEIRHKRKGLMGFYIYYTGQVVSLFGSALTSFVLFWYIAIISKDVILLAIMALFTTLPSIIIMPFAGVFVDRWNKKLLLGISDFLQAMTTVVIMWFFYVDQNGYIGAYPTIYYILVFIGVKNIFQAFQQPTFQAVVPIMVPEEKLVSTNSIMSLANALIEIISPLIAGVLIVLTPVTTLLWIDIITFFIGIIPLFFIHIPKVINHTSSGLSNKFSAEFKLGFQTIRKKSGLLTLLILFTFVNFTFSPINIIFPFIIITIHHGSAFDFAVIMFALQLGVIVTSIILATVIKLHSLVFNIVVGILGIYVSFLLIAFAPAGQISLIILASAGLGVMLTIARVASQTIWQKSIPKDLQGRVASVRLSVSTAISPIGIILTALLINLVNVITIIYLFSFIGILLVLTFYFFSSIRHIEKNFIIENKATSEVKSEIQGIETI